MLKSCFGYLSSKRIRQGEHADQKPHKYHTNIESVADPGTAAHPAIQPLSGRVSGRVRFSDRGQRRPLRAAAGRLRGALRNPHQYGCMRIAADAGIAPRTYFLDDSDRVVLTDFIEDRRLEAHPEGAAGLARAIGIAGIWLAASGLPQYPSKLRSTANGQKVPLAAPSKCHSGMANVERHSMRFLLDASGVARASFRIPPDCLRRFPG